MVGTFAVLLANQHHLNVSEVFGELAASFESYKYIGLNSLKGRCVVLQCHVQVEVCVRACVRACVCVWCVCVCVCVTYVHHIACTWLVM